MNVVDIMITNCIECKEKKEIHAKGLCQRCYNKSDHHTWSQKEYSKTDEYNLSMIKCHARKLSQEGRTKLINDLKEMFKIKEG